MKNVCGVGRGRELWGGPAEHGPEDEQDPMQVTDFNY